MRLIRPNLVNTIDKDINRGYNYSQEGEVINESENRRRRR